MRNEFIIIHDLEFDEFEPTELCDIVYCELVNGTFMMKRFKTLDDASAYREEQEINGQIIEI